MTEEGITEDAGPDPVALLAGLAEAGQFDDLEAAWMAAIEDDAFGRDDAAAVLAAVAEREAPKVFESLLWLLVSVWSERRGAEEALEAAQQVADLLPDSEVLREEFAGLYLAVRSDAPGIETLVEMALARRDLPLRVGLARLEKLLGMPPGTFVADSRRRSPGQVRGVDADRQVITVSFGDSERSYDAASVDALELGDPEDFRSLVLFDLERLQGLADEAPEHLARLVLRAFGPEMKFRDFKSQLEPVLPARAWSKWWSAARMPIKRSPYIEVGDGPQPSLVLRVRPRAFEDRARETFDEAETAEARFAFVLGYLKETGHDPASEADLLGYFAPELSKASADPAAAGLAAALGARAVLAEMHRRHPESVAAPGTAPPWLLAAADLAPVVASYADAGVTLAVLAHLREVLPDQWPEVLAAAMPAASPEACEAMATALADGGHEARLAEVAAEVMRRPAESVGAAFWLWQAATAGRFPAGLGAVDRVSLTIRWLLAADALARRAQDDRSLRPLVAQVRAAVGTRDGGSLRGVLESADDVQAKDIRAAIERNAALTDQIRARALDLVRRTHPQHFAKAVVPPWDDEAVLYTTPAALRKQEEVYGELVTRKMMENSKAIGEALSHGDISENAEFTAALEEQQRLTERATRLQADIAKAYVITPSMTAGETVTVGSRIRARRTDTGEEREMIFLGPWDADVARYIYFYRAPLALAFMGKRAGDIVTFGADRQEQRWEILEVGPGL